jgi:putative flippase GtrA
MPTPISDTLQFIRSNDFKTILSKFNERDSHPLIQFAKYSISGGVATVIFSTLFLYLSALFPGNPAHTGLAKFMDTLPSVLCAFMFSNAAVYWLNTRWVFTPGRHSVIREFLFFTLVNMPGAVGGTVVLGLLESWGFPKPVALVGFLVPNILINYICRKFFIFAK